MTEERWNRIFWINTYVAVGALVVLVLAQLLNIAAMLAR